MTTERLADTKLRLVREAIGDNIQHRRRARRPAEVLPGYLLPPWVAGFFLIASLVYVGMPSSAPTRGWVASAATPRATLTESPEYAGHQAQDSARGASVPRRLNQAVLPLSVNRIVLDPGHGGAQSGAISDSGVSEKEITLDIARRLRRLLEEASFEVLMTREDDETVPLDKRAVFANSNRADLFVSIHVNWIPHRTVRPLETYFAGPTDDPAALRLASAENRDSGYSLAAYRRLLEKIYLDTRRDESQALARTINVALYRSLSEVNPELENRGVKTAPFAVLIGTEMPAVLVEVSCLSNEADVGLLTKADHREKIAAALLRGIRSYANDLDTVGNTGG
jgi:N-acetylmuramoyl-L-alanine amidase